MIEKSSGIVAKAEETAVKEVINAILQIAKRTVPSSLLMISQLTWITIFYLTLLGVVGMFEDIDNKIKLAKTSVLLLVSYMVSVLV